MTTRVLKQEAAYPKPNIRRRLSGWEAGRLVLQEAWWKAKGRGVLTNKELQTLQDSPKTREALAVFDNLMNVGLVIELALLRAGIFSLHAQNSLIKVYTYILILLAPFYAHRDKTYEELKSQFQEFERLRQNPEELQEAHKNSLRYLTIFKGFEDVMGDATRVLEIPAYRQEMENQLQIIQVEVVNYNNALNLLREFSNKAKAPLPIPPNIEMSKLKPKADVVKAWKTMMARGLNNEGGLGEGWWLKGWQAPKD